MSDLLKLKTRLKLKKLRMMINNEVAENFGYSPNSERFNDLLREENYWLLIANENYHDLWEQYIQ